MCHASEPTGSRAHVFHFQGTEFICKQQHLERFWMEQVVEGKLKHSILALQNEVELMFHHYQAGKEPGSHLKGHWQSFKPWVVHFKDETAEIRKEYALSSQIIPQGLYHVHCRETESLLAHFCILLPIQGESRGLQWKMSSETVQHGKCKSLPGKSWNLWG